MDNKTKLRLAALGVLPRDAVLKDVMEEYSIKVAKAIQPLSFETAPIVAAILREYAEEIEKLQPGIKEAAAELMKLPRAVFKTGVKENGRT